MKPHRDPPALPVRLKLRAIDPERNIARAYSIDASLDLFGHWIVDLHWGHIGTRGQSRTLSFAAQGDAARFVRITLSKRASAKRRIGVGYQVVEDSQRPYPLTRLSCHFSNRLQ